MFQQMTLYRNPASFFNFVAKDIYPEVEKIKQQVVL
jgi:hypothetical protein